MKPTVATTHLQFLMSEMKTVRPRIASPNLDMADLPVFLCVYECETKDTEREREREREREERKGTIVNMLELAKRLVRRALHVSSQNYIQPHKPRNGCGQSYDQKNK